MVWITEIEIETILNEVIDKFLIPRYKELGMEASGNWARQLEVRTKPNGGQIWGEKYSEQLVYGRRPGKMPPVNAISRWLQQKGINANPWAVAKVIAEKGTTWYQRGGSDLLEALKDPETINYLNSKIAGFLQARVRLELIRNTKEILLK
jgi:hypothetical protein